MKIRYARAGTQDQNLEFQKDALTKAGCETIFEEKISGRSKECPQLYEMFEKFSKGDKDRATGRNSINSFKKNKTTLSMKQSKALA